jgi:hypothetical protein
VRLDQVIYHSSTTAVATTHGRGKRAAEAGGESEQVGGLQWRQRQLEEQNDEEEVRGTRDVVAGGQRPHTPASPTGTTITTGTPGTTSTTGTTGSKRASTGTNRSMLQLATPFFPANSAVHTYCTTGTSTGASTSTSTSTSTRLLVYYRYTNGTAHI